MGGRGARVSLSASNEGRQANTQQRQSQSDLSSHLIVYREHQDHSDTALTELNCECRAFGAPSTDGT